MVCGEAKQALQWSLQSSWEEEDNNVDCVEDNYDNDDEVEKSWMGNQGWSDRILPTIKKHSQPLKTNIQGFLCLPLSFFIHMAPFPSPLQQEKRWVRKLLLGNVKLFGWKYTVFLSKCTFMSTLWVELDIVCRTRSWHNMTLIQALTCTNNTDQMNNRQTFRRMHIHCNDADEWNCDDDDDDDDNVENDDLFKYNNNLCVNAKVINCGKITVSGNNQLIF